jgi:hypothetical protein
MVNMVPQKRDALAGSGMSIPTMVGISGYGICMRNIGGWNVDNDCSFGSRFTTIEKVGIATIIVSVFECLIIMGFNFWLGLAAFILYGWFSHWVMVSEERYRERVRKSGKI